MYFAPTYFPPSYFPGSIRTMSQAVYSDAALLAEITGDAAGLGLAVPYNDGVDTAVADLLNSPTGPGAATITLPSVPRDVALLGLAPAYLTLPGLSAEVQAKWDRILGVIRACDTLTINATTIALFGAAVTDGVLTAPQAQAIYTRIGSRAEVLWGAGFAIQHGNIAAARAFSRRVA